MLERIIHNKRLLVHYYFILLIIVIGFIWQAGINAMTDAVITIVLALYLFLFPVVILYTKKYAVHVFLFFLAFITGFYSYYHYSVGDHSILNALYFTFQLYLLVVTDVFTTDGSTLLQYPVIVEIARWSAALYTISTLFIAMYRLLEMSILLIIYQMVGNHYVVFGYNENSLALLENLYERKRRVILVASNVPTEVVEHLESLKIIVVSYNAKEEHLYVKCGIARAKKIILFYDKDMENLNRLLDLYDYFEKLGKKKVNLSVYIHLERMEAERVLMQLEKGMGMHQRYFSIKVINLYKLFVDKLFTDHPLQLDSERPNHLLLMGFGQLGQQIALKVIEQYKDQPHHTLHLTALDKQMEDIRESWQTNYPHVNQEIKISLQTRDVEINHLVKIIEEQSQPITAIYICLHIDNLDLFSSIELSDRFLDIPIFLEYSEGSITEKWIHSNVSRTRLIYDLGTFQEVLKEENILS